MAELKCEEILKKLIDYLKRDSLRNPTKYQTSGEAFEQPVVEGLISLLGSDKILYRKGSHAFPDIRILDEKGEESWGIEVKSTTSCSWRINGNSIISEARGKNLKEIYVLFGQIGNQTEILYRKIEDCVADVAVTHSPRFVLDFKIDKKNTLFSKMKLSLREFENAENPISLIAEYYKSRGKEAWWLPSDSDDSQQKMISPFEITLFCDLSKEKKKELISYGLAHFPEILCTSRKGSKMRYTRFVKWLFLRQSVICPNVRDLFSAGGKAKQIVEGKIIELPHVVSLLKDYGLSIMSELQKSSPEITKEEWKETQLLIDEKVKYSGNDLVADWAELATACICTSEERKSTLSKMEVLSLVKLWLGI